MSVLINGEVLRVNTRSKAFKRDIKKANPPTSKTILQAMVIGAGYIGVTLVTILLCMNW
ncbi:MAG: hypothetical protein KGV56_00355 [Gammaproteobacteria bacterium]|nr:hypothetical protein [Gammaproteobacteria bacterium]